MSRKGEYPVLPPARVAVSAAVVLLLITGAASTSMVQRDLAPEASRLVELLDLEQGARVADVGAGSGEMTVELAKQLGPDSIVYSTDINPERLGEIRKAVAGAALKNVTIVEGDATRTNLPDACCDALFVRHVYHHFGDPAAMNASIRRALKPGGRFAVMDFPPRKPVEGPVPPEKRATGDTHGVTSEAVVAELKDAGFEILEVIPDWPGNLFLVLARSPGGVPGGQTGVRPGSDRGQTRVKPGSDPSWSYAPSISR